MADTGSPEGTPWGSIFKCMQKILTNITNEFVTEAYKALQVGVNSPITKEDFCALFASGRRMSASPTKGSAKKVQSQ